MVMGLVGSIFMEELRGLLEVCGLGLVTEADVIGVGDDGVDDGDGANVASLKLSQLPPCRELTKSLRHWAR